MRYIVVLAMVLTFCYLTKSANVNDGKFYFVVFTKEGMFLSDLGGHCPRNRFHCDIVCTPGLTKNACSTRPCCTSDSQCKRNQKCCSPATCGCGKHCINVRH